MRHTVIALTLLLASLAAAQAQERRPDVPLLTVTGDAEVRAAPDEATVRLGVVAQAPTAREAQEAASAIAGRFLERLRELQVAQQNVQTSQLMLHPVYAPQRPNSTEPPRIVAYRAQNTLSVRLENLALIGRVIDAGVAAGANNLEGVFFGLRNDMAARLEALQRAVREARLKATTMAEALNIRLTGVYEVSEAGARVVPPPYLARGGALAEAAPTPVEPGQVGITASVVLRYQIRNSR